MVHHRNRPLELVFGGLFLLIFTRFSVKMNFLCEIAEVMRDFSSLLLYTIKIAAYVD